MFIIGTKKEETTSKLAFHLKNCEGGYSLPDEVDFLVNYGRIGLRKKANLNASLINNKYNQLEILKKNGIRVPMTFLLSEQYMPPRESFPWIARKYYHARGVDAIFLKTKGSMLKRMKRLKKRHYLVKYVPKVAEFRVHVLGNDIAGISEKVRYANVRSVNEEDGNPNEISLIAHPHIWCRYRGWVQIDYEGGHYETLKELGIKSVELLRYDFGAVDIILDVHDRFYVLEINSAPRLNHRRRQLYAKFFRKKWKEWKNAN